MVRRAVRVADHLSSADMNSPQVTATSSSSASTTSVSASRLIAADAQRLFDLVADPTMHPVIDGSGSVRNVKGGRRKLALGDRFTANMRIGLPYVITNTVVEYEEGRRIAWAHFGGWRWRWEFEPEVSDPDADDADTSDTEKAVTRVTETFDWSTSRLGPYATLFGRAEKNRAAMERSLNRLAAYVAHSSEPL